MSRPALLDVNMLLALLDPSHVEHTRVVEWFLGVESWATCPITENGYVRIVSQPTYSSPVSVRDALVSLRSVNADPHHEFWPCDLSIADETRVAERFLLGPKTVTDTYLLALAVKHKGYLATLDQRIELKSVPKATPDNLLVLD